jgi:hypothetical protein
MVNPIDVIKYNDLNTDELASRMDAILQESIIERYGEVAHELMMFDHLPSVVKILSTKHVTQLEPEKQREVCHLAFKCILQMQYTEFSHAATNHYVYGSTYNEDTTWNSSNAQIRNAALRQWGIISSRISMECFMELLHYLGKGESIKAKKSTFKSFKKWLLDAENPFSYFATHILKAFHFDREHRTPEVHASSRLSKAIILLERPSKAQRNTGMELTNIMLNVWKPLIEILDDKKCHFMTGAKDDFHWLSVYLRDNKEEVEQTLQKIFEEMK